MDLAELMLTHALTVNPGSTSTKLSRWVDGREVESLGSFDSMLRSGVLPDVVIYRVVHGGARTAPAVIDDAVVADLRSLSELAPLHQPVSLRAVDRGRVAWPHATHIACFDTSFHASIPVAARTYGLPARLREQVRSYGFHGLSYAWATARAREVFPNARRLLIAHLGGGQSLCGVLDGRSAVTTMGFTPLDGLVMATRCGAIDPGAILYLLGRGEAQLTTVLECESGLLGLSGTPDMREVLLRSAAGVSSARLARDVWLHRVVQHAGGCVSVLGGLDALVFTGGIGENSAEARSLIAERLAWLGVAVRSGTVAGDEVTDITGPGARVRSLVIRAREDLQMVQEAARLLRGRQEPEPAVGRVAPTRSPGLGISPLVHTKEGSQE